MTFFEALYGSQYYEITEKGGNGNSGRMNGNLFLTVLVILSFFLAILILITVFQDFKQALDSLFEQLFGYSSGKTIGKLLAIPLMGIIYFVVNKTVGSEINYLKLTKSFLNYPLEEKQKATAKILKPFFVLLVLFFLLSIASLF